MDTSNHPEAAAFDHHSASSPPVTSARPPGKPGRWAPWWLYLLVLLGANYLRVALLPVGTVPEPAVVVIALAQATVLFAVVTALWRLTHNSRRLETDRSPARRTTRLRRQRQ